MKFIKDFDEETFWESYRKSWWKLFDYAIEKNMLDFAFLCLTKATLDYSKKVKSWTVIV